MESDHTAQSSALPERIFHRYKPRFNSSDYPRRNGSTSVDDLMQNKTESGHGERQQLSESGTVQERLAYLNRERVEREPSQQQGGASKTVATPPPRPREDEARATEFGNGARGARSQQLSGSSPYDKYVQWSHERSQSRSAGLPRAGRFGMEGSFHPRAEPTEQPEAVMRNQQRQPANVEPTAKPTAVKVEPKVEPAPWYTVGGRNYFCEIIFYFIIQTVYTRHHRHRTQVPGSETS